MKKEIVYNLILILILGCVTSLPSIIVFLFALLIFTLPGIPFAHKFCKELPYVNLLYLSIVIGIPISSTICILIGYVAGFHPLYFVLAIVVFSLFFSRSTISAFQANWLPQKIDNYHYVIPAIILLILTFSYSNFGLFTASGYMFKDLYATDLLHHMSVFRYLPKGIPPANPYFEGIAWHYYWFSHMFPATVYSLSNFTIEPKQIMFLTLCLNTILFYNLLVTFIATFYKEGKIILVLLIISLLAYGYNDLYILFRFVVSFLPKGITELLGLTYFIDDAYGSSFSGYSHGWFRNFLVEPHSTLALALTFLFVSLRIKNGSEKISFNLFMGGLLGFIFAIDAFIGAIIISWAFIEIIATLRKSKSIRNNILSVISTFFPVVLTFSVLYLLGIIAPGGNALIVKPYSKMLLLFPIYFFVDYGPQIVFSVIGVSYLKTNPKLLKESFPFIRLFGVALCFMFFINISDIGTTQMFRKAGMIIRIPMVFYSGVFLENISSKWLSYRNLTVITCILLAIPTPFLDIYKLGSVSDKASTIFVKTEDVEACKWIKDNLPADAILQDFPGSTTPIVAFAERRVSLGDWEHAKSSGAAPEKIKERLDRIKEIFSCNDPVRAYNASKELNIDYIYVNQRCRSIFPSSPMTFKESKFFEEIYDKNGIAIYKLTK